MKRAELVEIIKTVVREEIDKSLPQYLMEVLAHRIVENSSNSMPIVEQTQQVIQKTPRKQPSVSFEAPIKQVPVQAPKNFTSNPILNQVLNETVGGIPLEETVTAPSAIDTLKGLPKEVLAENKEVAAVANAMTRDYSKLLKAIDAKSKSNRPL